MLTRELSSSPSYWILLIIYFEVLVASPAKFVVLIVGKFNGEDFGKTADQSRNSCGQAERVMRS